MRRFVPVLLLVLLALPLAAQNTDIEALSGLTFNFGNPGARSLGMGGAFLALADDASAAEANPAGLTILRKTEFTVESRNWLNIQTFATDGTFPDISTSSFNTYSDRAPVSFASVVMPIGSRFSLAAYYHVPIDQESDVTNVFTSTDFAGNTRLSQINFFLGPQGPVSEQQCAALGSQCLEYALFPFFTAVDIKLDTYGVAGGWKAGNFSLGFGVRYQQLQETAATARTDFDLNFTNVVSQEADDSDTTFTAGFKWAATEKFSIGGVYKQGAEFDTDLRFQNLQAGTGPVDIGSSKFHIPDTYGLGIAFRPIPALTINADAIRVMYSNLTDDFHTVLDLTDAEVRGYESDDVTEIHVGGEYFFATRIPFAIRAGWWRDPAHRIEYRGQLRSPATVAASILYPESEDQDHMTVGVGLAWPRFQIDAAYDTSDVFKVGSISGLFRF